MHAAYPLAPDWRVAHWLNTASPLTLQGLRGRVVVIHAFQMLCPACVSQALPQAARMHALFSADTVCVLGLHTVLPCHYITTGQLPLVWRNSSNLWGNDIFVGTC